MQSLGSEDKGTLSDDQALISVWYSLNQDKAILDREASLFRNLYFGMVNSTQVVNVGHRNSCGVDGVASCGWFLPSISGTVDSNTLEIIMDQVPGCVTHPKPMFIHGHGRSNRAFDDLKFKRKAAKRALN